MDTSIAGISPISRVPSEILLAIFIKSLPILLDTDGRVTFQVIRSVCPLWRAISFSSPILWTSVSVSSSLGMHRTDLTGRHVQLAKDWFSRSGPSLPLQLDFSDRTGMKMGPADQELLFELVVQHQERWSLLEILSGFNHTLHLAIIMVPPPTSWSRLHTLSLYTAWLSRQPPEAVTEVMNALEKITSIRLLKVVDNYLGYVHAGRLGHSGLTQLNYSATVNSFDSAQARYISTYTHLTTLVLDGFQSISLSSEDKIYLPSLLNLILTTRDTLALVHHMTTPSLIDFTLNYHGGKPSHMDPFSGFLSRNSNSLKAITLTVGREPLYMASLMSALSSRPSITSLTLGRWPFTRNHLFTQAIPADWCPNLQHLSVSTADPRASVELERLQSLAQYLQYRDNNSLQALEQLTVYNRATLANFPYDLFDLVNLGRLRVMVPWQIA